MLKVLIWFKVDGTKHLVRSKYIDLLFAFIKYLQHLLQFF